MCVPLSTPAGIRTLSVRRVLTRPSPSHSGHGLRITVPCPPQGGHGREVITWPRNERVTWLTSPRPPHTSQVSGWVPGALPSPEQVGHTTAVSTTSSRVVPNAHSVRSSSSRIVALRPRRARLRGPRAARPGAEEGVHDVAEREVAGAEPGGARAARPAANGSAPRSYIWRFSGSDSTS